MNILNYDKLEYALTQCHGGSYAWLVAELRSQQLRIVASSDRKRILALSDDGTNPLSIPREDVARYNSFLVELNVMVNDDGELLSLIGSCVIFSKYPDNVELGFSEPTAMHTATPLEQMAGFKIHPNGLLALERFAEANAPVVVHNALERSIVFIAETGYMFKLMFVQSQAHFEASIFSTRHSVMRVFYTQGHATLESALEAAFKWHFEKRLEQTTPKEKAAK